MIKSALLYILDLFGFSSFKKRNQSKISISEGGSCSIKAKDVISDKQFQKEARLFRKYRKGGIMRIPKN